ncbi:hypothetical protein [Nonomuraea sp. C10]|uniref:hypothetical protein n=1 Tax=Nonomuraea sp. C10 TaxID=2600577 RepID=UPI0011CE1BED|nr:hypothetical protein [Nonomuraea sp. C10]TXK43282.1 hypothetical protein FR742_30180 [Nonomuraea sp. C10]
MLRRLLAVLTLAVAVLATPTAANADTKFRGTGDEVIRIPATKKPGLVQFAHAGASNFIVETINRRGKTEELLVNEIGPYKGTVLFNAYDSKGTVGLRIKADGAWTATFKPVSKARCWCAGTIRGTGDQVLKLTPTRGLRTLRAAHNGESNFIVYGYTRVGRYGDLLINEIGPYKGRVLLSPGTRLVTVTADGSWTLSRR